MRTWELDRRKISEESQIYQQRHAELKGQYLGQYIAMHDGQVVDHDSDFVALRQRVRQQFRHIPVMITLVEEVAERPVTHHGFRMEATLRSSQKKATKFASCPAHQTGCIARSSGVSSPSSGGARDGSGVQCGDREG